VTCSHCYEKGHNKSGCSKLKTDLASNIEAYQKQIAEDKFADDWDRDWTKRRLEETQAQLNKAQERGKNRKCSYCEERAGHTRRTCQDRKSDIESEAHKILFGRKHLAPRLAESGLGVGALLEYEEEIYTVENIAWASVTQDSIIDENGYASQASRPVTARSFPSSHYARGRVMTFELPDEVTNINGYEVRAWRQPPKLVSPSPVGPPSDFETIEECRAVSKKLEIFNDGARPYKYMYPDG
jgi:hypothetical protein